MRAMVQDAVVDMANTSTPLRFVADFPAPQPTAREVRIRVATCGVCHTELDEIEGRTPPPVLPMIPGHQVIGYIDCMGEEVRGHTVGDRVGVGWIYSACGTCEFCVSGFENLCANFLATGRDRQGGYAEYLCVPEAFAIPVPYGIGDIEAAPLLCAGAIGYRSLMLAGIVNGEALGLTGFGASAHLVLKLVQHLYPDSPVYVFARKQAERRFALELGAAWAGETDAAAPVRLHAIIDTTPAWLPVVSALSQLLPRGRLVINAIRKESADLSSLLELRYPEHLWLEKEIKSVANVTRADISGFLLLASRIPIVPTVECFSLEQANQALVALKHGDVRGAKVLRIQ